MKNLKQTLSALFLVCSTILFADVSAPTNFTASNITDTRIDFTWTDNAKDEDKYKVCERTGKHTYTYINCSTDLGVNATSYTKIDASVYTSKIYAVVVYDGLETGISNTQTVKTTHTWDGELRKCVNEDLGNFSTQIPTKAELESLIGNFLCSLKGVTGSMDAVVDLKNITLINLSANQLTGSIPTEIGTLTNLESLSLYNNELTGSIPIELSLLTNLDSLVLSENNLSGSIPAEIGLLTNLVFLNLCRNQFTGLIPTEIGALTGLEYLYLCENNLSASIPTEIGALTDLVSLDLSRNKLTGSIPTEIGLLTNLEYLFLFENNLSAEIPDSIVNLGSMTQNWLQLHNNCDLYSEDNNVISYINTVQFNPSNGFSDSPYDYILDTNKHDCFKDSSLVPTIMYLLN